MGSALAAEATIPSVEGTPERLDWKAFSARYFPNCCRHDLQAVAAYAAYRHGLTVPR